MPEKMRILVPGMMGGMDDELFLGSSYDDMLNGGGGSDRFEGSPGADSIIGGTGVDYVSYLQSPAGVYVDIGNNFNIDDDDKPPVHGGHAEGDTLTEVEGLFGSVFGDTFRGDHQANRLFGWGGNDVIYGADGNDYIRGESGGDNLYGDAGRDELFGDTENDKLEGGVGDDKLWGGKGNDVLYGNAGNDVLEGGEGADAHHGGPDSDTAAYSLSPEAVTINLAGAYSSATGAVMGGHAEGDTFEYYTDADGGRHESIENLSGSMHDDMLTGSNGANTLSGGVGDDTLSGGDEGDGLRGGEGDDQLMGDDGNDALTGGPGADLLEGGEGDDTASYSKSPEGVRIDLSYEDRDGERIPQFMGGDAEGDTNPEKDIENLTGSDHADLLEGNELSNVLMGGKGDDWDNLQTSAKEGGLYGYAGEDTLVGGEGNDVLSGGAGRDDLWGFSGDDILMGGDGPDQWLDADGEPMMLTKSYNAPPVPSLGGPDASRGGLFGGTGDDTLIGGTGDDHIDGGSGNDTASYAYLRSTAITPQSVIATLGAELTLSDAAGAVAFDTFNLGEIDDGDAQTTDDPLDVRDAPLAVVVAAPATGVPLVLGVDSTNGVAADAAAEVDTLMGIENLTGGANDDILGGNDRANKLDGGGGNDRLTGGGGSDTFIFKEDEGSDTVTDFSRFDRDKIDLTDFELSTAQLGNSIGRVTDATGDAAIIVDWDDENGDGIFANEDGTLVVTLTGVEPGDLSVDDFII